MLEPVFGPLLVSKHDATTAPSHAMPFMGLARMPMRMPPVLVWCCWCRARSQAPRCRVASSGLSDFYPGLSGLSRFYRAFIELYRFFSIELWWLGSGGCSGVFCQLLVVLVGCGEFWWVVVGSGGF